MAEDPCILILDSDVVSRQPIAEYLRDCGYKVVEAVNTDEAAALLSEEPLKVDILLADVAAEGKRDGFALAAWARKNRPELKIILVGSVTREAMMAADLCQEGPQLAKPYHPQTLIDRIKRMTAARDHGGKA
jgi:DNA-binding response OmpR family regulator